MVWRMLTGFAPMPRLAPLAALLVLLAAPAGAQNWPTETSVNNDAIGGAFSRMDRLGAYPVQREVGEERRERITGWLGGVQEWVEERADMVGDRDREATGYYQLRRSWEREWNLNR